MVSAPTRLASCSLLALFAACSDDGARETDADTGTGTGIVSASASASVTATATATESGEPTTSEEPTTTGEPPPFVPIPARGGLEIDWVEANQGVGVAIGRDGKGVGGSDRTSYLIQNRVTLIRAFWKDLPADWTPRKIEGRLTVTYPDKTTLVLNNRPMIDGPTSIGNLEKSFYWGLMKEQVVPNITFNVELYEVAAGQEALPEPTTPPRMPHTGNAFVGIEDSDQVMKVTLIPFNYDSGDGCKTTPDTSPAVMQLFQDRMYMMNPLDRLDFTLHAPVDWNTKVTDFNQLNEYMSGLRFDEGAEPERYYYGLIDACSGDIGGFGGYAYGIPQDGKMSDAYLRAASGLWYDADFSANTFVHEIGHLQGRYHVFCSGDEAGTDNGYPTYPDEGQTHGEIHEWGFGVINFLLYHPTVNKDYMTYCTPVWASPYGWNKVYPVIKSLSSWDDAGAPKPDPDAAVLVGSVYPDGHETWISVPGAVDPKTISSVHSVEFTIDGKPTQQPAALLPQPHGDIVLVVTRLPERWPDVTAMHHLAGAKRIGVPIADIGQHHPGRLASAN